MLINTNEYLETVEQIKTEIQAAQYKAAVSVNQEMILLYHSIGEVINSHKVWGNRFIDNLAKDIKFAFPNAKGYSVRNLKYMAKFAETYPNRQFVQTISAQIPWSHKCCHSGQGKRSSSTYLVYQENRGEWLVPQRFDSSNREWALCTAGHCRKGVQF